MKNNKSVKHNSHSNLIKSGPMAFDDLMKIFESHSKESSHILFQFWHDKHDTEIDRIYDWDQADVKWQAADEVFYEPLRTESSARATVHSLLAQINRFFGHDTEVKS